LIDSCPVHPREVFLKAIQSSASAVVIIHNLCGAPHSCVMCSADLC
jgi:DNA repair protein RadC